MAYSVNSHFLTIYIPDSKFPVLVVVVVVVVIVIIIIIKGKEMMVN